jgi:radical SAM superfamily enzyme YgiQ (UPF0313 family)
MDLMKKVDFLEYNVIKKNWRRSKLKIALCYPNIYKAGMTGLTVQQLYYLFNLDDEVLCERCFFTKPLRTIESGAELKDFDVIAFTLQYEEDYVNMVKMLLDAGIKPMADERGETDPIIIAGGQAVSANPLPVSKIVDCTFIGELEPCLSDLLEILKSKASKRRKIEEISSLKFVYRYGKDKVERCMAPDLDHIPHILAQLTTISADAFIDPLFANAFCLEVSRSCNRRCRFCLVSWTNGPLRYRSLSKIKDLLDEGLLRTKASRVVLIGTGIFDVPWFKDVCTEVLSRNLGLSIPSLRPDVVDDELLELIRMGGQKTLALGVESLSEEDRAFLGKAYDDEVLENVVQMAVDKGLAEVKFYLITCLPKEDLRGSAKLIERILKIIAKGKTVLHISMNPLIPKPHTPFQWLPPPKPNEVKKSYKWYLKILRGPRVRLEALNPYRAAFQAALSLSDDKLGPYLVKMAELGLKSWTAMTRLLPEAFLKPREETPWDVVDVGYDRRVVTRSFEEAMRILGRRA